VEVAPEVTIIAPAGTGKTTTLLQLASHVLARNTIIPLFFRLGDWSAGSLGLLAAQMALLEGPAMSVSGHYRPN
jgi:hypothetical protein